MKICSKEGCNNNVWSNEYCKYHQYLRNDLKAPKVAQIKRKVTGEKNLFNEIWTERPHISAISGTILDEYKDGPLWYNCFAHILSKGLFPLARLDKENIMLITPWEHILIDQGMIEQRRMHEISTNCSFDIFYDKQKLLKEKYGINKSTV